MDQLIKKEVVEYERFVVNRYFPPKKLQKIPSNEKNFICNNSFRSSTFKRTKSVQKTFFSSNYSQWENQLSKTFLRIPEKYFRTCENGFGLIHQEIHKSNPKTVLRKELFEEISKDSSEIFEDIWKSVWTNWSRNSKV